MTHLIVLTTVGSQADARRLARAMVEQKLAACAQIAEIESFYPWDGALQQEAEWRIAFKTRAPLYQHLEDALKAEHPYKLPAIVAFRLDHISPDYAGWIDFNVLQMPGT
jgi:periplasmic divalent cation tolerance protein